MEKSLIYWIYIVTTVLMTKSKNRKIFCDEGKLSSTRGQDVLRDIEIRREDLRLRCEKELSF